MEQTFKLILEKGTFEVDSFIDGTPVHYDNAQREALTFLIPMEKYSIGEVDEAIKSSNLSEFKIEICTVQTKEYDGADSESTSVNNRTGYTIVLPKTEIFKGRDMAQGLAGTPYTKVTFAKPTLVEIQNAQLLKDMEEFKKFMASQK